VAVEKYLSYRGEIKAAVGVGGTLAFVTAHPEGHAAALYRLDAGKLTLDAAPLPGGGTALVAEGDTLWLAGDDARLSEATARGGAPRPIGAKLEEAARSLAVLADGRLAALAGSRVVIVARDGGKAVQTLDLPEPGTCLAADPTGRWLAAGTSRGTVAVFEAEGKPEFQLGAAARLHEGAVTSLLFEPDELRFFSAGADLKLLSTHARGRLEPEDKGRSNNHAEAVTALLFGPGDRLYSGSRDGSIKSWPRAGGVKPATVRDGVGRVVALAMVTVHDRPRLVAACDDNTIRIFPVDASGKIGDSSHRIYDAYDLAAEELKQDDASRRESALKVLAGHADARSVEKIAAQAEADPDHALRLMAAELLAASDHPRALTLLGACLTSHRDEAGRVAAFRGLRRRLGESDLGPIDLALRSGKADIGRLAVEALRPLASKDDQALGRLTDALDHKISEVRQATLVALESAYDPTSPGSNLVALGSKHADVRRMALVRLYRRKLLDDPAVQSALRRRSEDADPEVRRAAFLLGLHTRDRLLRALRARDPELERQLVELEGPGPAATPGPAEKPASKEKEAKKPKGAKAEDAEAPTDDDLEPLLQATASRALDTSLRGARGLAILGDPRAFGLLLQLSREEDKAARAEVCRAMATLDDARAIERLRSMLHDKEAEVRDAAFTAMARIHQAEPLLAAESGLNASYEDVRRRGLQALVEEIRKASAGKGGDPGRLLLAGALNDNFPTVRAEAFKSTLALKVGGGGAATLRFAARSIHPDVRREVLTEAMAHVGEPWGWDLVLESFNDPDPALRGDAFAFAVGKIKGLEFLEAALGSRFADLRMKAVQGLVRKHTPAAQAILARGLDDEDRDVRLAALASLVDADSVPALATALDAAHPDVRLGAARALARHGDPRALGPLVALATAPEPRERERQAHWLALAESALHGLGDLGDPAALTDLIPALDSPHAAIRKQAARALAWVARPGSADAARQALGHADPEVKYNAALALAYLGDPSAASLVFSEEAARVIAPGGQIAAATALGDPGEDRLVVSLDDPKHEVRNRALLLLMMREWKDPRGTAARCLACLSSRTPRLRLTAARGLESLHDPAAFAGFIVGLVNDRGDKPAWKIPEGTVDALAELLVHGDPQLRARTSGLLRHLAADEQDAFDLAWKVHEARFAGDLADLRRKAGGRPPVPPRDTADRLRELAFGAYVGLVREQGGSQGKGQPAVDAQAVTRVRQTALARLLALAEADVHRARAARPVFVQAMGDPNGAVRSQAFDQALAVGMAPSALAAEALATGHVDLGVRGLELLTGGTSEAEGRAVLERAMLSRKDDLAIEAARLLIARRGPVDVAARALEAAHEPLRKQAVSWLAAEYDRDPAARDPLRKALGSRFGSVREAAALELASKKDPAAFEALVGLLGAATEPARQRRVIAAMEAMGDPRDADALLDRVANDPGGTALADELIRAVGRFRRPESADRLLSLLEKEPKRQELAFAALLAVTGYDQPIADPEDERPDDRWERDQHPRRDDVLARLLDRLATLPVHPSFLLRLLPGARWARGKEVDPPLAGLVNHPDDLLRQEAVKALGWRLRKRGGDPEPLRKALGHRDPTTQFLAAEGLARAGRPDGLNVLMASIDFATDLEVRRGAVAALGELGDEQALDVLLKLAAEDGHALQEQAAEAIGHMGRSSRSEEVSRLLERQARGQDDLALHALKGLRWLNTRAGWQLIRRRADDPSCPSREEVVALLGHDDDPATRDLLLRLIATLAWNEGESITEAMTAARRLFGPDSPEPDYAAIRNEDAVQVLDGDEILGRVRDRGEPGRIFALLPKVSGDVRDELRRCLLDRAEPPVAEAKAALDSPDPAVAGLAARVLGRAGPRSTEAGPAIETALARWLATWEEKRTSFKSDVGGPGEGGKARYWMMPYPNTEARWFDEVGDLLGEPLTGCVRDLVWASGRLGVAREAVARLVLARPDDPEYRPIRREGVLALASGGVAPGVVEALESAAMAGDPESRAIAAQAVGRLAPDRASKLAEKFLPDRVGFRRLSMGEGVRVDEALRSASRQVHYQGVVLSVLIDRGEVATLAPVAEDRSLPEATRLGAVEGLAAMGLEEAEDVLRRVGAGPGPDEEEDLRKAAWRGLRRSKRSRRKAEVKP